MTPGRKLAYYKAAIMAVAVLAASNVAAAQDRAQIAIVGGTATDQMGVRSNAVTVAPQVWFSPDERASLALGANVTRFQAQAWSLGASASFAGRESIAGPVSLMLDASASATRLSGASVATFAFAEGAPALQVALGSFSLFGGVRLATGTASIETSGPRIPALDPTPREQRRTTGAAGPSFGASMLTAVSPDAALRLTAREDRLWASGAEIVDRALSATYVTRAMTLTGSAGRRRAPSENNGFGSAALSVAMRDDLALEIAAGRYASNPLMGTPGGTYLNAGLSLRVGSAAGISESPQAPRVPGAPTLRSGYSRLAIAAPDAQRVEVAGDFSDWKAIAATRAASGMWYADLRIAPGQYRYAFRVNGTEWRVPNGATAVDDGYGGKSAWLVIAEDERSP